MRPVHFFAVLLCCVACIDKQLHPSGVASQPALRADDGNTDLVFCSQAPCGTALRILSADVNEAGGLVFSAVLRNTSNEPCVLDGGALAREFASGIRLWRMSDDTVYRFVIPLHLVVDFRSEPVTLMPRDVFSLSFAWPCLGQPPLELVRVDHENGRLIPLESTSVPSGEYVVDVQLAVHGYPLFEFKEGVGVMRLGRIVSLNKKLLHVPGS